MKWTERVAEDRQGFTLVELLLVIAILGILGTVAVVRFGGVTVGAKIETARTSINSIGTAISLYDTRTGKGLPDSLDQLTQKIGEYPAPLDKDDLIDPWGQPYQYSKVGKYDYKITSGGPDGSIGGDDDITD